MTQKNTSLQDVRKTAITGLLLQLILILPFAFDLDWHEKLPSTISDAVVVLLFLVFIVGYIISWIATHKYVKYKGFPSFLSLVGAFNIFGLAFIFLLDNKNRELEPLIEVETFNNFSISSILISYGAIPILLVPFAIISISFSTRTGLREAAEYFSGTEFYLGFYILSDIVFTWFLLKEIKASSIQLRSLFGLLKKINLRLSLGLAIAKYFFAKGLNSIVLFYLSFTAPGYVEQWFNFTPASTLFGWILYFVSALVLEPIVEELFFRGIVFHKISQRKGILAGVLISSIAFSAIHFRFDVMPLFIGGVVYTCLYVKTRQLTTPILSHFFYNFMSIGYILYSDFYPNIDQPIFMTAVDYQIYFQENLHLTILYLCVSTPCLAYFIFKNFPRHNDIDALPYFTNQRILET